MFPRNDSLCRGRKPAGRDPRDHVQQRHTLGLEGGAHRNFRPGIHRPLDDLLRRLRFEFLRKFFDLAAESMRDYTRYNPLMNHPQPCAFCRLIGNFTTSSGTLFCHTSPNSARSPPRTGHADGDETILDLGCGNGELADVREARSSWLVSWPGLQPASAEGCRVLNPGLFPLNSCKPT